MVYICDVHMKNNIIIKINKKGVIDKMPLIELNVKQLKKEDIANLHEILNAIIEGK